MLLPALTQYYKVDFTCTDPSGTPFEFSLCVAHPIYYSGNGSELGGGSSPTDQLKALADGMAAGLAAGNAPSWATVNVTQISAQPQGPTVVYTAT